MKKLLNALYVTTPDAYLTLEGETIALQQEGKTRMQIPLLTLENIFCFTYIGASPKLLSACAERSIGFCFLSPSGRFLARVSGPESGNVLLRKKQYLLSENQEQATMLAKWFLLGKVYNSRKVVERALRDHAMIIDKNELTLVSQALHEYMKSVEQSQTVAELMGIEGVSAKSYFSIFDSLILQQKQDFFFTGRSRRPPMDNVNSLLSFCYTLLTHEVASALEGVGLDPYVGYLHADRPGRPSLALDLMEELRPVFVDRFVLSIINRRQVNGRGFVQKEGGGVIMEDETRKDVLKFWQQRKKDEIVHPFLKERILFGLVPHVQALLLARYLRGDLDAYPPYFWS